jgi:hypothetical protein
MSAPPEPENALFPRSSFYYFAGSWQVALLVISRSRALSGIDRHLSELCLLVENQKAIFFTVEDETFIFSALRKCGTAHLPASRYRGLEDLNTREKNRRSLQNI